MSILAKSETGYGNNTYVLGILGQPVSPTKAKDAPAHPKNWYHNSAAVLVKNGTVVAAIEEERLTRLKNSGVFPINAIKFCIQAAGINITDVDYIAFGEKGGAGELLDDRISETAIDDILRESFSLVSSLKSRIRLVEHHVGHLMSAFLPSGYEKALVVSTDGFGDGISGAIAVGEQGQDVVRLLDLDFANSLGRFYSSVMPFLGYDSNDEYRVMGLAPYGDASRIDHIFSTLYSLLPAGKFAIENHSNAIMFDHLRQYGEPRADDGVFTQFHMDIAAGIQLAYETIMLHVLRHYRECTGLTKICMAGGTAQNSSFNGKLLQSGLFGEVYIQPAAHDAGVPLGAALYVYQQETQRKGHAFTVCYSGGALPERDSVESLLQQWSDIVSYEEIPQMAQHVAARLAQGEVIGWMQGRSEFGPRALGNRSILADPRPASMKDLVNAKIKSRESYRPFAPAVIAEFAHDYFEFPENADLAYMTMVTPVRQDKRDTLGAVTHIDGSARVQVVRKHSNPEFWNVIKAFHAITGTPVLLNTSFNNNREPIVETAEDGLRCFLTTALDGLVIGNFFVTKRDIDLTRHEGFKAELFPYVKVSKDDAEKPILIFKKEKHSISQSLLTAIQNSVPVKTDLLPEVMRLWSLRLIDLKVCHE